MAKHNATGRSKTGPPFVMIPWHMLETEAWIKLSGNAMKVYCVLAKGYRGHNNGQIHLSVRRAAKEAGITPKTAGKALSELEDKGFIRCHMKGHFDYKCRHASEWELTAVQMEKGRSASCDFRRWSEKSRG